MKDGSCGNGKWSKKGSDQQDEMNHTDALADELAPQPCKKEKMPVGNERHRGNFFRGGQRKQSRERRSSDEIQEPGVKLWGERRQTQKTARTMWEKSVGERETETERREKCPNFWPPHMASTPPFYIVLIVQLVSVLGDVFGQRAAVGNRLLLLAHSTAHTSDMWFFDIDYISIS